MKITFTPEAWKDYLFWQENDKKTLVRINNLIKEIIRQPFSGIGKPEPLRHELKGFWSRRITAEHRIVYQILDGTLAIVSVRYHYD